MRLRISTTILTFLFCSATIKAQEIPGKFRIGLSAGLEKNVSSDRMAFSQYTGFLADYDRLNYRVGLNISYPLKSNLAMNAAVNYSNKDFTGTYFCDVCDFAVSPSPEKIDFRFIEVPITLKYYFSPHKIRMFGEAGLNNLFPLTNLEYEAKANSFVAGLKLGIGIAYDLSQNTALELELNYNNSISKLFKDSYYDDPYFMPRSLNFGIVILRKI